MTQQSPITPAAQSFIEAPGAAPAAPPAVAAPAAPPRTGNGPRWTPAKMAAFLRALASTHSVSAAAKSVGMSRMAAYRLRARTRGKAFDQAWDSAFRQSYANLPYAALDRALNGIEVPVYYIEAVGEEAEAEPPEAAAGDFSAESANLSPSANEAFLAESRRFREGDGG